MTSPAQKTHLSHPHPTPSPPGGTCPAKGSTSNPFLAGLPRRLGVDKLLARLLLRGVPANRMIPPRLPRAIRLANTPCLSKPRHRELSPKFLGGHTPLPTSTAFTSICPAPRPGNIDLRPQVQKAFSTFGTTTPTRIPRTSHPYRCHVAVFSRAGGLPLWTWLQGRTPKRSPNRPSAMWSPEGRCAPAPTLSRQQHKTPTRNEGRSPQGAGGWPRRLRRLLHHLPK